MKKSIFLFFAAILCAMTANAQWYLMGTVTDWNSGKQMTGDSKVVSVTINLKANTNYELKIKNGSSWYGNGGTMSSTNNLAWEFSTSNNSNAKITTKDAGDYTFTWYISDKKLSVTYPNHNYIVAGDGDVMEDDWSPSSTKNKMVKQDDGTYRLTKTNRSLTAKTYGYKLTVGSWSVNQYPKDNVSLKVTAAGNYNVIFTYNPKNGTLSHELVPIYTITASANPTAGGNVTGTGTYAKDASVALEATANPGYEFVNWTVGGVEKSTDATYSFTASADVTAIANFELSDPEVPTYAISVSANDDAMGTVTGAGDYTEGSPVTLTATPKTGYRFVNWTVGSEVKSTEATYSFTASEALTIVANFEAIPKYDITVKAVVPETWTNATIGIHYWGDGISGTSTPVATEKEGNWNKYTIKDVLEGQSVNVIFLNGTSWGSDKSKQTANITGITEDKCFQISAKALDSEGKCTFTEVDCAADIKPEGDVYTMMGAGELGLSWNLETTGNDMTKQGDGTYTLVKEGLDLATTGTYEYKVVKNHSWDWSIPSGNANQTLKVDIDGTYTVTFTLSADKKKLTAEATCTAEKEVILDCFVAGTTNLVGGTTDFTDKLSMTYDEGSKTYTKTFTALLAGNYQMKVVYGSDWLGFDKLATPVPANVTKGDDNKIKFSLAEAGDVTVTYNVEKGIGLVGNFAAPAPVTHTYTVAGDAALCGEAWNWELAANDMTNNGDGTYTWTKAGVTVEGELSFKVFVDHKSEPAYPAENWVIKPENYEGVGVYDVTITFTESSKEIAVALTKQVVAPTPDYTRTTTAGKFGTICLPFGGEIEGAELYECVGKETGKVYIASVTTLEAGKPYIFKATAAELAVYSDGTTAPAGNHNGLYGTFNNETVVAAGDYILLNNELRPSDGTAKVNENRAYLVMSKVPEGAPTKMPGRRYVSMSVTGENEATGFENIITTNAPVKVIENGQLIIIRNGEKFNAQGQKL